ncbi:MAG TPA: tetratricopeptide repeat protein, partial [Terriglobia bacterium]|nr:tetratricopeptide repeat protein [Terriglobia bacterium]
LHPDFALASYGLALVHMIGGKLDQSVSDMEKVVHAYPESSFYRAHYAYALAKAGRTQEARKILGELIEESKTKYVSWLGIAYIYVGLDEQDHSFAALELAYQQGDTRMYSVRSRAHEGLESAWIPDPRFAQMLKKIGLPPLN